MVPLLIQSQGERRSRDERSLASRGQNKRPCEKTAKAGPANQKSQAFLSLGFLKNQNRPLYFLIRAFYRGMFNQIIIENSCNQFATGLIKMHVIIKNA